LLFPYSLIPFRFMKFIITAVGMILASYWVWE